MTEAGGQASANSTFVYTGRLKPFMGYRSRYCTLSTLKERVNSNSSIASVSGSTQNLLDPVKLMSMQEDARCRRISSEVMKRCLYRPDVPGGRRRAYSKMYSSTRMSSDGSAGLPPYARMVQSMPVTPAQSLVVTPAHSPTNMRNSFFSFLSRGATPRAMTPETEEDAEEEQDIADQEADTGLASVLRPQPRYVPAFPKQLDESISESGEDGIVHFGFATLPRATNQFHSLNAKLCHNQMSE